MAKSSNIKWVRTNFVGDLKAMADAGWDVRPEIHLRFDGGCGPENPGGVPTFGWQLYSVRPSGGDVIDEGWGVCLLHPAVQRTNNTAEWAGVTDALEYMRRHKVAARRLTVIGDSMLVLNQLSRAWGIKKPWLRVLADEAFGHLRHVCVDGYAVKWVPREQNTTCHELAALAFRQECDNPEVRAVG